MEDLLVNVLIYICKYTSQYYLITVTSKININYLHKI